MFGLRFVKSICILGAGPIMATLCFILRTILNTLRCSPFSLISLVIATVANREFVCQWKFFHHGNFCPASSVETTPNLDSFVRMFGSSSVALSSFAIDTAKARQPILDLAQAYLNIDTILADIKLMDIRDKKDIETGFTRVRALTKEAGKSMMEFGVDLEHAIGRVIFAAERAKMGIRQKAFYYTLHDAFCNYANIPVFCPSLGHRRIELDISRALNLISKEFPHLIQRSEDLIETLDGVDQELQYIFILLHDELNTLGRGSILFGAMSFQTMTFRGTFEGVEGARDYVDHIRRSLGRRIDLLTHAQLDFKALGRYQAVGLIEDLEMDGILEMITMGIADLSMGRKALREPLH